MPITLNPSSGDTRQFKVAAVQAEPVWLDLEGGVKKTIDLIREAAASGARIIGFPELFIPGYPWTTTANDLITCLPVLKEYQANALPLHSPEMDRIRETVKEHEVNVVLGFAERDGNTLYISQVTITQDGKIANHRRKIKPTMYEKILFGDGSAQSVYNVVQTPYGRLGSLNCWEHMQPWLKTHFYSQHPQIFVGAWPPFFPAGHGGSSFASSAEGASRMTQFVAMEGGCFGLACSPVVSEAGAAKMKIAGFPWFKFPGGGFTTIYGPDGSAPTPPVDPAEETIVYATISLDKIDEAKLVADIVGNYLRSDLFHTVVRGKNWSSVAYDLPEEQNLETERQEEINNALSSAQYRFGESSEDA